ncbi:hypothetical protein EPN29_10225 [bacterium]|nr:MAG: hypothetical protein EPN29_10225 [bacterium]
MRRWLVALAALTIGGGVSAALLVLANPARDMTDVYVAARDVPAGAVLGAGVIALERIHVTGGRALLFTRGDESKLVGLQTTHDLLTGQLIQRSDVGEAGVIADRRLVFVPVKEAPPATPGSKVDLLVVGGAPDHPSVTPFALAVEVRATVAGGLVVVVASRQAAAFVYAASNMHLAAVIAEPGAADGSEESVSTPEQAMAVAGQR